MITEHTITMLKAMPKGYTSSSVLTLEGDFQSPSIRKDFLDHFDKPHKIILLIRNIASNVADTLSPLLQNLKSTRMSIIAFQNTNNECLSKLLKALPNSIQTIRFREIDYDYAFNCMKATRGNYILSIDNIHCLTSCYFFPNAITGLHLHAIQETDVTKILQIFLPNRHVKTLYVDDITDSLLENLSSCLRDIATVRRQADEVLTSCMPLSSQKPLSHQDYMLKVDNFMHGLSTNLSSLLNENASSGDTSPPATKKQKTTHTPGTPWGTIVREHGQEIKALLEQLPLSAVQHSVIKSHTLSQTTLAAINTPTSASVPSAPTFPIHLELDDKEETADYSDVNQLLNFT